MNSAVTTDSYNYKVVRQFAVMTVVWGIVGMLVGVIIAAQMAWPELNFGVPWLSFGRLRPLVTAVAEQQERHLPAQLLPPVHHPLPLPLAQLPLPVLGAHVRGGDRFRRAVRGADDLAQAEGGDGAVRLDGAGQLIGDAAGVL